MLLTRVNIPTSPAIKPVRWHFLALGAGVAVFGLLALKSAWLCDDAYITFRTVENFSAGYGLTWNVAERVQTYSHPLWMLLLVGFHQITGEIHYTSMLVSVLFSLAAVYILATRIANGVLSGLIGIAVLCLSKAFVDYSTSGLENALTHLLLVMICCVHVTLPSGRPRLGWLALLSGLLMLNRLDTLLLTLPLLAVAYYQERGWKSLGVLILGIFPLLAWEAFSLFYYGSLVPNTAYAKLNTGLPLESLIRQGLLYLWSCLKMDPLTPLVIAASIVVFSRHLKRQDLPLLVGMLLYLLYVISIGGDFMQGRFLTAPLLLATVVLLRVRLTRNNQALILVLVIIFGVIPPRSPLTCEFAYGTRNRIQIGTDGIADERAVYFHGTRLLSPERNIPIPDHSLADLGRCLRTEGPRTAVVKRIGMCGYFAGPNVHIVDPMGLGDPLLSRLKPNLDDWRIGHFPREIPAGYLETLDSGLNHLQNPRLAEYYDRIAQITRGELLDPTRWGEIIRFNLDYYEYLETTPADN